MILFSKDGPLHAAFPVEYVRMGEREVENEFSVMSCSFRGLCFPYCYIMASRKPVLTFALNILDGFSRFLQIFLGKRKKFDNPCLC